MNKKIRAMYKREMLDILRDKKTVFMNIFVPVILYPLIAIIASQIIMSVQNSEKAQVYHIAIVAPTEESNHLKEILNIASPKEDASITPFHLVESAHPSQSLKDKAIDAYVEAVQENGRWAYHVNYISSVSRSNSASLRIESALNEYKQKLQRASLIEKGMSYEQFLDPIQIKNSDHATKEQSLGSIVGNILPLLILMSLVNGATFTAIDCTAGEKERGTLETTFSLPVSSKEIIWSKFYAVTTMASISVFLNFLSLGGMAWYFYTLTASMAPDRLPFIAWGSFAPVVLIMFVSILFFGVLISAFTLTLFAFSKTVKEAQNYAIPLFLIIMMVGYIGFIPQATLGLKTAAIPIVNVVLMIKSLFLFDYPLPMVLLVLVSNLAYGLLTIQLMVKAYDSEEILFSDSSKFLSIFEKRSNLTKGGLPMPSEGLFLAIIGMLGLIYIGSYCRIRFGFYGLLAVQGIILILAFGFALYSKFDIPKIFYFKIPRITHLLGSVFLWMGTLMVVVAITSFLQQWFPDSFKALEGLEDFLSGHSFVPMLLVVAVAPAICEELFFRGFVFSSFRSKMGPWVAMLLASMLFGIYHTSVVKFFTTAILGLALNYSLYKSRSIFTSSLMHFLNNALSVVALYFQDKGLVPQASLELAEGQALPSTSPWIIIFAIIVFVGLGVALLNTGNDPDEEDPWKAA